MGYAAPQVVEGQPREGLPYGLFSAFSFRTSADEHWANGIEWEALSCDPAQIFEDPDCDDTLTNVYSTSQQGSAPSVTVVGSHKCGTPGGRADVQAQEKATTHLLSQEQTAVETHIWGRLAADPALVTLSNAPTLLEAIAELEQYGGDVFKGRFLIHGSRRAISRLGDEVHSMGGKLYTNLDTQLVAGAGYGGGSPNLTLYATPAFFGYRGPVFNQTLVDPKLNDAYALAQRSYVVGWDPCPIAEITATA